MAHKKIIDSVKKQGQVAIKDLDEFLRFVINESDMRTFDANYISILIPMQFDIDKVFGLNVCKRSDDDYVILYSCWYPNKDVFGRQFESLYVMVQNRDSSDNKKPSFSRFAKWEFGGFIVDSKTIYMASKPVKALLQSSDFIDDMDVFEKLDSIRIPLFRKNIPADPAMFQDKDTVDKAVRNACSAFLFGTRCNEFSNLIRTMYPLNDDDVIHYLSSPSDWAEETSSVITASNGTASRIYYMARLIAIDRMSELFLTFYEHDSADPKDITNVCKSMMDAVEPYKVVTLVMDYIDDKKMGEHLEVDCPSHLIRDADVLRRKGISVTRISAFAKPEDTQRFVCKHPNLIKQVEKGTNMFDVFVFPIDCITRIRAGEKVLWTNPTT